MNIIKELKERMSKAVLRKDLHMLNILSQEILNLINRPYTQNPFLNESEIEGLNTLFNDIAVYIVFLTVRSINPPTQQNIRRN